MTRDPAQRLGANGAEEIKRHPFFAKHIDFKKLMAKAIKPPFKPSVESAADTSNFDTEFTSEAPMDSVVEDSHLSASVQANFQVSGRLGRCSFELERRGPRLTCVFVEGFTYVQPAGAFGESVR